MMSEKVWFLVAYQDRQRVMIEIEKEEIGTGTFAARKVALKRQRLGAIPPGIIVSVVRVT